MNAIVNGEFLLLALILLLPICQVVQVVSNLVNGNYFTA